MRAIQSVALGEAAIVEVPEPDFHHDSILVRPTYVGNNPCDHLQVDMEFAFTKSQVIGCDYCGIVEKVGAGVKADLKPGDKVVGGVPGGLGFDLTRGAFQDIIPANESLIFRLPENLPEPKAATLGVGISTIAVAFYELMGLPYPDIDPSFGQGKPFLIYAGSSAMGLFGIQFAKLSGFRVVTTCSEKNFGLVKSYGADEAYDYHDISQCTKSLKESVGDDLSYAYICNRDENVPKLCADILKKGGIFCAIVPGNCPREDVRSCMAYGQSAMVSPYKAALEGAAEASAETKANSRRVWELALKYLNEGRLKVTPIELRHGLEGALQGIDDLRNGRVSGKKIISKLS